MITLLTAKPVIYAANLDEDGFSDPEAVPYYRLVEERAAAQGAQVIPVCAKLEAEIAELDAEEKKMFLDDLGIAESGLDRLIKASYTLLGLISVADPVKETSAAAIQKMRGQGIRTVLLTGDNQAAMATAMLMLIISGLTLFLSRLLASPADRNKRQVFIR